MGNLPRNDPSVVEPKSEFSQMIQSGSERIESNSAGAPGVRRFFQAGVLRNPIVMALFIAGAAFCFFLAGIGNPAATYYDEGFYVPAARAFLTDGSDFNLSSPPLGKLLVALGMRVAGDNPLGWRLAGAACGSLTLAAIFLWTYLLSRDMGVSWTAAALSLLNHFLFVMSRVAMMDVFLVFFLFWSLVAYTAALELELSPAWRRILLCCTGVLLGLAGACKWNAVDTLLVLLVASFAVAWMPERWFPDTKSPIARYARNLRKMGIPSLIFGLLIFPAVTYSLAFWPLCRALHLPFGTHQIVALNLSIWRFQIVTVSNPAIASAWYTWPFKISPQMALSYLLGNPVVMWGGLTALAFCLYRFKKYLAVPEGLVAMLYAANLLQWAVTPKSGTFYYYYFPEAMFLGVAIALTLHSLPRTVLGVRLNLIVLIAAALVFLWCYPRMAHLGAPWDCALGCWS